MLKKAAIVCFAGLMSVAALAGCGPKDDGQLNNSLTIEFFGGGYGEEWAEELAIKFAEETGIMVDTKANGTLLSTINTDLQDKNNDVDIYFSHGLNWEYFSAMGYLEPMDDLYEMEVENGVKLKDRMDAGFVEDSKFNNHYYKVPWTKGAGGLVFNMKLMEENGWEVPETYADLEQLCEDIVAADLKSGSDTITPFVWPGQDQWLWDYVVFEWWGQLAGAEKVSLLMTYESKADTFNPETNWKEMKQAYQYWYDLVVEHPEYSFAGSQDATKATAQSAFVNGKAVMMPNAHWTYNETKLSAPEDFEMELHVAPVLPDAKEGNERINFMVGYGDSIIIPATSKNKDVAKQFIAFMAREENCVSFSSNAVGVSLAFNYDMSEAGDNQFAASVSKILNECKNIDIYSQNPVAVSVGSEKLGPWPNNTYYYRDSFGDPSKDADYVFEEVKEFIDINWPLWENSLG